MSGMVEWGQGPRRGRVGVHRSVTGRGRGQEWDNRVGFWAKGQRGRVALAIVGNPGQGHRGTRVNSLGAVWECSSKLNNLGGSGNTTKAGIHLTIPVRQVVGVGKDCLSACQVGWGRGSPLFFPFTQSQAGWPGWHGVGWGRVPPGGIYQALPASWQVRCAGHGVAWACLPRGSVPVSTSHLSPSAGSVPPLHAGSPPGMAEVGAWGSGEVEVNMQCPASQGR